MKSKKYILIAGCCGNVGGQTAAKFKENGWGVVGLDIKDDCACSCSCDEYYKCDITDAEAVLNIVKDVDEKYQLDAMFNAAGYEIKSDFEETDISEWKKLLDTILGGAANLCNAVGPCMVGRNDGKIILLSPDYSKDPKDQVMNASASGSLHGFAKSFGVEVAPNNVLVNVLFANTPFDMTAVVDTAFYLADKDTYTSAQVVSVTGQEV